MVATLGATVSGIGAAADAATTSNLRALRSNDDSFDNYDFGSARVASDNVDWPVTMLFRNNAEVDKIKAAAIGFPYPSAGLQYGRMDNSFGWFYDADGGVKTNPCPTAGASDVHVRLYGDPDNGDHNYSPGLGFYVIGTTHYDMSECSDHPSYGYSEGAEAQVTASIAAGRPGWRHYDDIYDMKNPESSRTEGNHIWQNDGLATQFDVD